MVKIGFTELARLTRLLCSSISMFAICLQENEADGQNRSARRPVWLDGAVSAANQAGPPPVPRPTSRPKRGMDASPFAGLMSKKPFRRRSFEPIKEEPDSNESAGTATAAELSSPDTSGDSISTSNLLSRLPSIPTVVTTNTFMQVSSRSTVCWSQVALP